MVQVKVLAEGEEEFVYFVLEEFSVFTQLTSRVVNAPGGCGLEMKPDQFRVVPEDYLSVFSRSTGANESTYSLLSW